MHRDEVHTFVQNFLSSRDEIVFAYLFGSIVDSEKWHDVDVAVYVDPRELSDGFEYAMRVGMELEKHLHRPVDLILMNDSPDHLIHHISKGKLILNRDDDFRVDFLCTSWKRYFDIQPKRMQAYADMLS